MRLRHTNFYYLLPLASLMLAACTSHKTPEPFTSPDSEQWQQHQQTLKQLSHYQIRGAFAYLSDKQKIYARFFWQQYTPDHYRLLLTNPLGSTELDLVVKPGSAQLTDSKGKHHTSDNAEKIIQKLTGMSIPLNNLRQWILGLPADANKITLDRQYRLKQLSYQQNGQIWIIDYREYSNQTTPSLPSKIELTQNEQRIKLKMDNWAVK